MISGVWVVAWFDLKQSQLEFAVNISLEDIEYEIIGEGSQISTNQKRENSAFSLLIGQNLRPFPDNFVLYWVWKLLQWYGRRDIICMTQPKFNFEPYLKQLSDIQPSLSAKFDGTIRQSLDRKYHRAAHGHRIRDNEHKRNSGKVALWQKSLPPGALLPDKPTQYPVEHHDDYP